MSMFQSYVKKSFMLKNHNVCFRNLVKTSTYTKLCGDNRWYYVVGDLNKELCNQLWADQALVMKAYMHDSCSIYIITDCRYLPAGPQQTKLPLGNRPLGDTPGVKYSLTDYTRNYR